MDKEELPNGWEWKKLDDISELITSGATPRISNSNLYTNEKEGIPFFRIQNIGENGLILNDLKFITKDVHNTELKRSQIEPNDVLITITGRLGTTASVPSEIKTANINQHICMIRLDGKSADSRYISCFLNSAIVKKEILKKQSGTTRIALNHSHIRNLLIPLPPLSTQRKIVAILEKAERAKLSCARAEKLIDELLKSVFVEMFGDPVKNEKGWEKVRIEDLIYDMHGGAPLKPDDFIERGFPVLHKGAIKPYGRIELDPNKKTYTLENYAKTHPQSIINKDYLAVTLRDLVPTGPSIGLIAEVTNGTYPEYILAQGAYGFRINEKRVVSKYLVMLSNIFSFRASLKKQSVGSTQIHIRTPIFMRIIVPLPPLQLQKQFARIVEKIEAMRERHEKVKQEIDNLFDALMQKAFTGELIA